MINDSPYFKYITVNVQSFYMKIYLENRSFNYETRPTVTCKHLPWVGDGDNAEVKRNVNCDLYEKKGKAHTRR